MDGNFERVVGSWRDVGLGRTAIRKTTVEIVAVRHCAVQRRCAKVVERLSRRSLRDLSGTFVETLLADRYGFAERF